MRDKILEAFKQDLIEDGKAKKTIGSYVGDVKSFLEWLKISVFDILKVMLYKM